MKAILSLVFVLALAAVPSRATLGVDVAYNYPLSSWSCLKSNGYQFAIVRCYQSLGHVDAQCAPSVQKAWNAGFKNVDLYVFPCPKCGNATGQIQSLYDYVKAQNVNYGLIWLDIEGGKYKLSSELIKALLKNRKQIKYILCVYVFETYMNGWSIR